MSCAASWIAEACTLPATVTMPRPINAVAMIASMFDDKMDFVGVAAIARGSLFICLLQLPVTPDGFVTLCKAGLLAYASNMLCCLPSFPVASHKALCALQSRGRLWFWPAELDRPSHIPISSP